MEQSLFDDRDHQILHQLTLMAQDVSPVKTSRLAAALSVRGEILAYGYNSLKTHPFQARFNKNAHANFWHAETNAIHNFLRRHDAELLAKSTLYVVRCKRPTNHAHYWIQGMAKPCAGCNKCIDSHGIPRVIYSLDNEGFACDSLAAPAPNVAK